MDREITALRDQINTALDDEDRMMGEIDAMQRQIADWDQQADAALRQGDEAAARQTIRQIQLQQQRMTMHQAELEQHKLSTSELIRQVNMLEAIVAEAKQHQQTTAADSDDRTDHQAESQSLSARLRKVSQPALPKTKHLQREEPIPEMDEQAIEDDLARRRTRLSQ